MSGTSFGLNPVHLAAVDQLAAEFRSAHPFPHLHIDNIFTSTIPTTSLPTSLTTSESESVPADENDFLAQLTDAVHQLQFNTKSNDLYAFAQSNDLRTTTLPPLAHLRDHVYSPAFRAWMTSVVGHSLSPKVDMSCAIYRSTDTLLCHDDRLEGRIVAWIIYLVDDSWSESDGGQLDLYAPCDGPEGLAVAKSLIPRRNSMAFFEVSTKSWHAVREVLAADKERISVSGWFYLQHDDSTPPQEGQEQVDRAKKRAKNRRATKMPRLDNASSSVMNALQFTSVVLDSQLNAAYQSTQAQRKIQKHFARHSYIVLQDFLQPALYASLLEETLADVPMHGPPYIRHMGLLGVEQLPETTVHRRVMDLLRSDAMVAFLTAVTGFDALPRLLACELHRYGRGDYSLAYDEGAVATKGGELHWWLTEVRGAQPSEKADQEDGKVEKEEEWDVDLCGGNTVYMDEDDVLLTVPPKRNALVIVFADRGCMRFVKYLNHRIGIRERIDLYCAATAT
jgi:Rps23 Pro-64 3,4-dihydroxylase Tpa1-like proline 4-hydroxylase